MRLRRRRFWQNIVNKRYSIIAETPANRWSIADYYDPDPAAPDKSYSKIGGWVRRVSSLTGRSYRIPPKVAAAMDEGQQWAVTIADEALTDYGYPEPPARHRTHRCDSRARRWAANCTTSRRTMRAVFPEYAT
jgi:acyl transferase domain-containing protein